MLKNSSECPACRRLHLGRTPCQCRQCGMMLFNSKHDFRQYSIDSVSKNFWVFTIEHGWIHAVHALEGLRPNEREYTEEKLPENYGTMDYINEKKANANFEAREYKEVMKNKKIRSFGK
mgnify:CR=1 FL=1